MLGAFGLIVPADTRIQPRLAGIAEAALTVRMALAGRVRLTHGEAGNLPPNLVLGGLSAFVAWGRLEADPISWTVVDDALVQNTITMVVRLEDGTPGNRRGCRGETQNLWISC